jgi:hypothetical protein
MEKTASNFNFSIMEKLLSNLDADHSGSTLSKLKNEINRFFSKAKCRDILYTVNTDKMFFGMRVYPLFNGDDALEMIGNEKTKPIEQYYLELDSKLFDPMLALDEKELTAILLHEIGHIVYDTETIDEVRKQVDLYFAATGDYADLRASKGYKELLGYALKDAVMKAGSLFTRYNNDELIADAFVTSCGYGPYLETAMRKIMHSSVYMNKDIDDRFITLSWVLRLRTEFGVRRLPAIHTLNKAKQLTSSQLEKREIDYALRLLNNMDDPISEGVIDAVASRFSKKFNEFKIKGIRSIKNDVYELNLRLRCAQTEEDLLYIIRTINSDIAILQDYLSEDLSNEERQSVVDTLQELYDVRQKAAKEKSVKDLTNSMLTVIYPD